MAPTAHFPQPNFIEYGSFDCDVCVLFCQVDDLVHVNALLNLASPDFFLIESVLVGDYVATCEAFDRNDHYF